MAVTVNWFKPMTETRWGMKNMIKSERIKAMPIILLPVFMEFFPFHSIIECQSQQSLFLCVCVCACTRVSEWVSEYGGHACSHTYYLSKKWLFFNQITLAAFLHLRYFINCTVNADCHFQMLCPVYIVWSLCLIYSFFKSI